ncbi:MAG: hypothetical protein V5A28_10055 [Haloarculaceae archaeon]
MGTSREFDGSEPPGHEQRCVYVAVVTETGVGRTCTISPVPTSGRRVSGEWIMAREESFVPRDRMR